MMTARTAISSSLGVGWFLGLGFVILVIGTLVSGGCGLI
jgi:hypothetical protein